MMKKKIFSTILAFIIAASAVYSPAFAESVSENTTNKITEQETETTEPEVIEDTTEEEIIPAAEEATEPPAVKEEEASETVSGGTVSGVDAVSENEAGPYTLTYRVMGGQEDYGIVTVLSETVNGPEEIQGSVAEPNNGYEFIQWSDEEGNILSEEPKFVPETDIEGAYFAEFAVIEEKTIEAEADGHRITATGLIPSKAELSVSKFSYTDAKGIEDGLNAETGESETVTIYDAFDISILLNGEVWQPVEHETEVAIRIEDLSDTLSAIEEKKEENNSEFVDFGLSVQRIDSETGESVELNASADDNAVEFNTEHFTTFTIGGIEYDTSGADNSWDISAAHDGSVVAYWFADTAKLIVTGSGDTADYNSGSNKSPIAEALSAEEFELNMENGITSIGNYLFYHCGQMNIGSFSEDVTRIGTFAFEQCNAITSINLTDNLTRIEGYAFAGCHNLSLYVLPDSVTHIGGSAFQNCYELRLTDFPASLTTMQTYAFRGCTGLQITTLPSSLSEVPNSAFEGCTGLVSIVIPSNYTLIGQNAFKGCTGLGSIEYMGGANLTQIKWHAFYTDTPVDTILKTDSDVLTGYDWATDNRTIVTPGEPFTIDGVTYDPANASRIWDVSEAGDGSVKGYYFAADGKFVINGEGNTKNYAMGEAPSAIFKDRDIRLVVSSGVTSIGDYMFYGCNFLTCTSLPSGITYIGQSAFENEEAVSTLSLSVLPESLVTLGESAFKGNPRITTVKYMGTSLVTVGDNAFYLDPAFRTATTINTKAEALKNYDWAGSNRPPFFSQESGDANIKKFTLILDPGCDDWDGMFLRNDNYYMYNEKSIPQEVSVPKGTECDVVINYAKHTIDYTYHTPDGDYTKKHSSFNSGSNFVLPHSEDRYGYIPLKWMYDNDGTAKVFDDPIFQDTGNTGYSITKFDNFADGERYRMYLDWGTISQWLKAFSYNVNTPSGYIGVSGIKSAINESYLDGEAVYYELPELKYNVLKSGKLHIRKEAEYNGKIYPVTIYDPGFDSYYNVSRSFIGGGGYNSNQPTQTKPVRVTFDEGFRFVSKKSLGLFKNDGQANPYMPYSSAIDVELDLTGTKGLEKLSTDTEYFTDPSQIYAWDLNGGTNADNFKTLLSGMVNLDHIVTPEIAIDDTTALAYGFYEKDESGELVSATKKLTLAEISTAPAYTKLSPGIEVEYRNFSDEYLYTEACYPGDDISDRHSGYWYSDLAGTQAVYLDYVTHNQTVYGNGTPIPPEDTEWQRDYNYTIDDVSGTKYITLTGYKGTATTVKVPAEAVIEGVHYKTRMNETFVGNNVVKKLSFEDGVEAISDVETGSNVCHIVSESTSITSVDFTGTTFNNAYFYHCPALKNITGLHLDNTAKSLNGAFYACQQLQSIDVSDMDVSGVYDMTGMFYMCQSLKTITGIENWDTRSLSQTSGNVKLGERAAWSSGAWGAFANSGIESIDLSSWKTADDTSINMSNLFEGCSQLKSVKLSGMDTSHVISMDKMFLNCRNLTEVKMGGCDLHAVKGMQSMFAGCSSLKAIDMSDWNTTSLTNIGAMFMGCQSLEYADLSPLDLSKVTSICYTGSTSYSPSIYNDGLFEGCRSLTGFNLTGLDVSKLTSLGSLFEGCQGLVSLDLSSWDTSNILYFDKMFKGCSSLTSIDMTGWNTSKAKLMNEMFSKCTALHEIDVTMFNTSNVEWMNGMFYYDSFEVLDLSSFNTEKVNSFAEMFAGEFNIIDELDLSKFTIKSGAGVDKMFYGVQVFNIVTPLSVAPTVNLNYRYYQVDPDTDEIISTSPVLLLGAAPANSKIRRGPIYNVTFMYKGTKLRTKLVTRGEEPDFDGDDVLNSYKWYRDEDWTDEMDWTTLGEDTTVYGRAKGYIAAWTGYRDDLEKYDTYDYTKAVITKDEYTGSPKIGFTNMDDSYYIGPSFWIETCEGKTEDLSNLTNSWSESASKYKWYSDTALTNRVVKITARDASEGIITPVYATYADSDWQESYEYDLDNENKTITIRKYISGSNEDGYTYISPNATIDGYRYSTILPESTIDVSGDAPVGDGIWTGTDVEEISIRNRDTSSGEKSMLPLNLAGYFHGAEKLSSVNIAPSFYNPGENDATYFPTDTTYLFYGDKNLRTANMSGTGLDEAVSTRGMFEGCGLLSSVTTGSFDVASATDISRMFKGVKSLAYLDMSDMQINAGVNATDIFADSRIMTIQTPAICKTPIALEGTYRDSRNRIVSDITGVPAKTKIFLDYVWYEDYDHEIDDTNKTITVTKYNGYDLTHTLPAETERNGETYRTVVVSAAENPVYGADAVLESLVIEDGVDISGAIGFCKDTTTLKSVTLPSNITDIPESAFEGCVNLSLSALPETVTGIGGKAFKGAGKVHIENFPANLVSIGSEAFSGIPGMDVLVLGNNVTAIGSNAFFVDEPVVTYVISDNPTVTGYDWASDNRELQNLTKIYTCGRDVKGYWFEEEKRFVFTGTGSTYIFNASNNSRSYDEIIDDIEEAVFVGCTPADFCLYDAENLRKVVFTADTKAIPQYMFTRDSKLSEIAYTDAEGNEKSGLPAITTIRKNAFDGCSMINISKIPDSIISIGDQAFRNCPLITNITGGENVTEMGNQVYYLPTLTPTTVMSSSTALKEYDWAGDNRDATVSEPPVSTYTVKLPALLNLVPSATNRTRYVDLYENGGYKWEIHGENWEDNEAVVIVPFEDLTEEVEGKTVETLMRGNEDSLTKISRNAINLSDGQAPLKAYTYIGAEGETDPEAPQYAPVRIRKMGSELNSMEQQLDMAGNASGRIHMYTDPIIRTGKYEGLAFFSWKKVNLE